ncbi:TIR-like protein DUF1863 [Curtobacterium flaccumfaciens]|uniref:TIR-like protein DUF1863 n=1 Tax=Curtobacterium flaccumfaciens TaxID=2035 RepID=A0A4R6DCN5_9MICO|nr:TIR domain-containing protein [Curtobacterium flaccumfaciens]TDN42287.1 TIR-like protein DUF1863 [Curtobacterium flaccumfaciens]
MRKVFFSFHFERDAWRVGQVRNSNVVGEGFVNPYYDRAAWETIKKGSDAAIKKWIDGQIKGTSVTAVLIGSETASRKWVQYEIEETIRQGHGLIGIDISKIKDKDLQTDPTGVNPLPVGTPYYAWNRDNGRENLGTWIEEAAK